MGLFSNIGRGALGWSTGGLSELGRSDPFGLGGGNGGPSGPGPWNPITAKNTTISPDLTAAFGNVGTNAQNSIGKNYSQLAQRQASDATARGMNPTTAVTPNSYAGQRFAVQQGIDTGNLEAALGGSEGSTAYNNALQQRDYGQQSDLASQIAALNRPDLLQQIFQGIGAVGKPIATFAGAGGFRSRGGNNYPQVADYSDAFQNV